MHPLILLADGSSSNQIELALIAAMAVVLAALIPAVSSLFEREPRELTKLHQNDDEYRDRLEQDAALATARCTVAETQVRRLERYIWSIGIDPETLEPIRQEPR